jgi:iron(II)-dependent oxidoreductase
MSAVRQHAIEAPVTDGELHELVIRHELQHTETMLQAMTLAGVTPPSFTGPAPVDGTGLEMAEVPEGPFEMGEAPEGFAYDNERPRHAASTGRFTIGRTPVTNATWSAWIEAGGYARREWWSEAGWAWREREGVDGHQAAGGPNAPVVHVTWFEADAFARAHQARLPTEAEWEIAGAGLDPEIGNFADDGYYHPRPAASDGGLSQMFGDCWEWTASPYVAYPGYRPAAGALGEYNGKFMCNQLVLRGGSCVSPRGHLRATYRNFFPPEARWQFSGIRLARDL